MKILANSIDKLDHVLVFDLLNRSEKYPINYPKHLYNIFEQTLDLISAYWSDGTIEYDLRMFINESNYEDYGEEYEEEIDEFSPRYQDREIELTYKYLNSYYPKLNGEKWDWEDIYSLEDLCSDYLHGSSQTQKYIALAEIMSIYSGNLIIEFVEIDTDEMYYGCIYNTAKWDEKTLVETIINVMQ